MATVTGFTAERMKEIEDTTIVGGFVNEEYHLILQQRNGVEIDAGPVRGPVGPVGPTGPGADDLSDLLDVETAGRDVGDVLYWDGVNWVPGINIKVQNVAPLNPDLNDLWVDTA